MPIPNCCTKGFLTWPASNKLISSQAWNSTGRPVAPTADEIFSWRDYPAIKASCACDKYSLPTCPIAWPRSVYFGYTQTLVTPTWVLAPVLRLICGIVTYHSQQARSCILYKAHSVVRQGTFWQTQPSHKVDTTTPGKDK